MTKILVADDDREIAELIGDCLYDEGYEVLLVHDGESALNTIYKNLDIEMVILDIMMPKMDGLDVCKRIREKINCSIVDRKSVV